MKSRWDAKLWKSGLDLIPTKLMFSNLPMWDHNDKWCFTCKDNYGEQILQDFFFMVESKSNFNILLSWWVAPWNSVCSFISPLDIMDQVGKDIVIVSADS